MEVYEKNIIKPMKMTLYSSRVVDIFNLKENEIDIEDISHALSNLCRYGGHCLFHYSVAQHSVLCSLEDGTTKEQLEFLLHDSSEAFVNDLIRPIKHRPDFKHYRIEEDKIQEIIFKKYGLNFPLSKKVHDVDNKILKKEMSAIIINPEEVHFISLKHKISFKEALKFLRKKKLDNCIISKISPEEANEMFLNRFYELYNKLHI